MLANLRDRAPPSCAKTKELEAFTYSIAHDLKGPLREIEGFSSLLGKAISRNRRPTVQHHIDIIRVLALRLTHMIDALLKYSRLEQQDLPRTRFNVLEMITSLLVDRQSQLTGMTPQDYRQSPLRRSVWRAGQHPSGLVNLLDNALKFSRYSPMPTINIGGQQTPTEHILWIQDNGIGFDADQNDKLFGLFERLHNAREYEGTGVGLAIVKIVRRNTEDASGQNHRPAQAAHFFWHFPNSPEAVGHQLSAQNLRQG